jgi:hypothetical protein
MTEQDPQPVAITDAGPHPEPAGRADIRQGLGWFVLGVVVLVLSVKMDRLANQGVAPYAAPGLLPGLLGIAMMLFGGQVALRGRRAWLSHRGGGAIGAGTRPPQLALRRLLAVMGLCVAYSVGLIGHGLPFWLASAVFVSVSILVLQQPQRQASGRKIDARALAFAVGMGIAAGVVATLVFQTFFLVRLP